MTEPNPMTVANVRETEALGLAQRYATWSLIPGVLPMPLIDLALLITIQIRMLEQLARLYQLPFSNDLGKALISSLVGGIVPTSAGFGTTGMLLKSIPGIGGLLNLLFMPAFAWAATYAVGRIFIQHFESGGTFLTFDPVAVRDHFRKEFENEYAARSAAPAKVESTPAEAGMP